MVRRGEVYIAPSAFFSADGRMVDPETSRFWVSWQNGDEGVIEDSDIVGAEAAIVWCRERADEVSIRLGHRGDTYYWAGEVYGDNDDDNDPMPRWPPAGPPPGGWWIPGDEDDYWEPPGDAR